jgi:hypothetical protein
LEKKQLIFFGKGIFYLLESNSYCQVEENMLLGIVWMLQYKKISITYN